MCAFTQTASFPLLHHSHKVSHKDEAHKHVKVESYSCFFTSRQTRQDVCIRQVCTWCILKQSLVGVFVLYSISITKHWVLSIIWTNETNLSRLRQVSHQNY